MCIEFFEVLESLNGIVGLQISCVFHPQVHILEEVLLPVINPLKKDNITLLKYGVHKYGTLSKS
jgi:hypothetical protein